MIKPSKNERQDRILELIMSESISTQTDLVDRMRAEGMNVTQATISRDIKELNIVKMLGNDGNQHYISMGRQPHQPADRLLKVFAEAVVSVKTAQNMLVVKTLPGMAPASASAIDSLSLHGVVGTLAGDDTIFIVAETTQVATDLSVRLDQLFKS